MIVFMIYSIQILKKSHIFYFFGPFWTHGNFWTQGNQGQEGYRGEDGEPGDECVSKQEKLVPKLIIWTDIPAKMRRQRWKTR